jgi:hypothetical protein
VWTVEVPADERQQPCLTDEEVVEIASLGKRVERALGALRTSNGRSYDTRRAPATCSSSRRAAAARFSVVGFPVSASRARLCGYLNHRHHEIVHQASVSDSR